LLILLFRETNLVHSVKV